MTTLREIGRALLTATVVVLVVLVGTVLGTVAALTLPDSALIAFAGVALAVIAWRARVSWRKQPNGTL